MSDKDREKQGKKALADLERRMQTGERTPVDATGARLILNIAEAEVPAYGEFLKKNPDMRGKYTPEAVKALRSEELRDALGEDSEPVIKYLEEKARPPQAATSAVPRNISAGDVIQKVQKSDVFKNAGGKAGEGLTDRTMQVAAEMAKRGELSSSEFSVLKKQAEKINNVLSDLDKEQGNISRTSSSRKSSAGVRAIASDNPTQSLIDLAQQSPEYQAAVARGRVKVDREYGPQTAKALRAMESRGEIAFGSADFVKAESSRGASRLQDDFAAAGGIKSKKGDLALMDAFSQSAYGPPSKEAQAVAFNVGKEIEYINPLTRVVMNSKLGPGGMS